MDRMDDRIEWRVSGKGVVGWDGNVRRVAGR
jgi:hypothetical protein